MGVKFFKGFFKNTEGTASVTGMALLVLMGALMVQRSFALSGMCATVAQALVGVSSNPWVVMAIIQVILIIGGMLLPDIALIVLLVPLFLPAARQVGIDPIWFASTCMVNLQFGHMTPPFAFGIFVLQGLFKDKGVTFGDVVIGSIPFMFAHFVGLLITMFVPSLSLFLPSRMVN